MPQEDRDLPGGGSIHDRPSEVALEIRNSGFIAAALTEDDLKRAFSSMRRSSSATARAHREQEDSPQLHACYGL